MLERGYWVRHVKNFLSCLLLNPWWYYYFLSTVDSTLILSATMAKGLGLKRNAWCQEIVSSIENITKLKYCKI